MGVLKIGYTMVYPPNVGCLIKNMMVKHGF